MTFTAATKNNKAITTFELAITEAFGVETVSQVVRSVKRDEAPSRRAFEAALRKTSANSMDRLRYLCEAARTKPTNGKVTTAQRALVDFMLRNKERSTSKKLTRNEIVTLSSYYQLHLAGVKAKDLGRTPQAWGSVEALFDYVESLEGKLELKNDNH
jgi:hypothetical protein